MMLVRAAIVSFLLMVSPVFWLAEGRQTADSENGSALTDVNEEREEVDHLLDRAAQRLEMEPEPEIGELVREILRLSTTSEYRDGYLEGLFILGESFLIRSMPDSARVPIHEALSRQTGNSDRIRFLRQAARADRQSGDLLESLSRLREALEIAESIDDENRIPRLHFELADGYRMIGNSSLAFESLYRAYLFVDEEIDALLTVDILLEIADLYRVLESPSEGFWYLEEARRITGELDLEERDIRADLSLGVSHLQAGGLDEAEKYLVRVRENAAQGSREAISADHRLGALYLARGQREQARYLFSEALERGRQAGMREAVYYGAVGLGELELSEGRGRNAVAWFETALEQAESLHVSSLIGQALELVYSAYRDLGDELAALQYLERLRRHSDEVRTLEYERARAEYEARFEADRQQQENRMLRLRQAEQEARIQLQRTVGVGGILLLLMLGGVSVILYNSVRTRERLNVELREKNRELDRINGVKDQLFAVIAHDLRGPLNSLKGLLPLLQQGRLNGERLVQLTGRLEQSLQENASAMENLLVWASSQMSGIELKGEEFNPQEIGNEVVAECRTRAVEKGVPVRLESDPGGNSIHADVNVFRLVLRNLLTNAIKFSSSGEEVVVNVSTEGNELQVKVKDHGRGMDAEEQKKIFGNEFFSRKGTGSERGSGLGLRLCRDFLAVHGGSISVESEFGKGTTFRFTLPQLKVRQLST